MSTMKNVAMRILESVIEKEGGNRSSAARFLGVTRPTLIHWITGKRGQDMEVLFQALERAGAQLLPPGEVPIAKTESKELENLRIENAVLRGQVEMLRDLVSQSLGTKDFSQAENSKKAAG